MSAFLCGVLIGLGIVFSIILFWKSLRWLHRKLIKNQVSYLEQRLESNERYMAARFNNLWEEIGRIQTHLARDREQICALERFVKEPQASKRKR